MTPEQIEIRIKTAYPDADVAVMDSTGGSNHFDVRVAASHFKGLTRIQCHRTVMDLFQEEFKTGELHALQIMTVTK